MNYINSLMASRSILKPFYYYFS